MPKVVNGVEREETAEELAVIALDRERSIANRPAKILRNLRAVRNKLLVDSDDKVHADQWAALSTDDQEAWSVYRQELRDLPASTSDAENPVWPTKP
jgi:hypothetical protein|tara:strand:+ start:603 stop:893 length:291 start_codon:yes stop_codon:yes gene_type:complete